MNEQVSQECEVFEALLEALPDQQREILANLRKESPSMCGRLEKLLALHYEAEAAATEPPNSPRAAEVWKAGHQIDRYQIIHFLGAGGEADVYLAQQQSPVQRKVALKILRYQPRGRTAYLARFDAEKSALARLAHPCIAKLYDAGTTDQGQHYCAVEYVDGATITQYVAQRNLPLEDRLKLFCEVCAAVAYANESGVLHRDIKPSNIMVTETGDQPRPVVIDFGIAKINEASEEVHNTLTKQGDLLGTLGYLAPERLKDARVANFQSEVYSLGALLYELVSGVTMLEVDSSRGIISAIESLKNCEITKPSQRVKSVHQASLPSQSPRSGTLSKQLSGELDWICLKAVDKTPEMRFASVRELRKDVMRFLAGDPVESAPPKRLYLMRKFYKRHRLACVLSTLLLASLCVLAVASMFWSIRLNAANKVANQLAAKSQNDSVHIHTVLEFMMTAFDDPEQSLGAVAVCGEQLFNTPTLQNDLRRDVGYNDPGQSQPAQLPSSESAAFDEAASDVAGYSPPEVSERILNEQRVNFYDKFAAKQIQKFGETTPFVIDTLLKKAQAETNLNRQESLVTLLRVLKILDALDRPENDPQRLQCGRMLREVEQLQIQGALEPT